MKLLIIILTLSINLSISFSQKEAYNWYFGANAGLSFNTPDKNPIPVTNGALNSEAGCAVISDKNARLLFYTNGETVWDKNHNPMLNGQGLAGSNKSTQSAIIVPRPGYPNIYYIITTDDTSSTNGCRYSVVDLNLGAGLGDITIKNSLLFTASTEKLVAIKHSNGRDWWVLTHEWNSDAFRAFLIDTSGINTFAIFSVSGTIHRGNPLNKTGYMKASLDGSKLALVLPYDGVIELFEFDNSRGKVLNPIYLSSLVFNDSYGIEFSKTGRRLYVTKREEPSAILQFDISSWSQSAILNSQTLIVDNDNYGAFRAMQIGPDDKIYVSRYNKSYLGRIENPDSAGRKCNYIDSAVSLNGQYSKSGLPNIYSSDLISLEISSNSPVCISDTLRLYSTDVFGAKYEWEGPLGFRSSEQNPVLIVNSELQSGYYKLSMTVSSVEYIDSIFVQISSSPELEIFVLGNSPFCDGDSVLLTAVSSNASKFIWSTGDTTENIYVKKSGIYSVTAVNPDACKTTKDTSISIYKILSEIVPLGPLEFCQGDSVELIALPIESGGEIIWSTGETSESIFVKETGQIVLTIISDNGCLKRDTVNIKVYDLLEVTVNVEGNFCEGDTVKLSTNYEGTDFIYLWSTGERSPSIKITKSLSGWVYVKLKSGCGDTAYFNYKFNTTPNVFITSDKTPVICEGDILELTALTNNIDENLSYLWSTGDTTQKIRVSKSARYNVIVTSDSGCTGAAYIDVEVLPTPVARIIADGPVDFCEGGSLKLSASPNDTLLRYLWSTGDTTNEISVNTSGLYFVIVSNSNDCSDTAFVLITVYDNPIVEVESDGPLKICKGNTVSLYTKEKYLSYLWNTGDTTESIVVSSEGKYNVSVIDSNGCEGQSDEIEVIVSEVNIAIDDLSKTKFGNVCVSSAQEQSLYIINDGDEAITISALNLKIGLAFSLRTEPVLPAVIESGESLKVIMGFNPKYLGILTDTMKLSIDAPCSYQYEILLSGRGTVKGIVRIPDTVRPIGIEYCIPVFITLDCGDSLKERVFFKTKVSLDLSMFLPDNILSPFVKRHYISGSRRIFEIEGYIDSLDAVKTELFQICGTILYGKYEWAPVQLDEFEWNETAISTVSYPGELEIYGICEFDLSQIKFIEPTTMNINHTSSSDIYIEINTAEIGPMNLQIFDIQGNIVYSQSFVNSKNVPSEYILRPNLSEFSSGYYRVVLYTLNRISSLPLILYR